MDAELEEDDDEVANMVVDFDKQLKESHDQKDEHTGSIERFKQDIAQLQDTLQGLSGRQGKLDQRLEDEKNVLKQRDEIIVKLAATYEVPGLVKPITAQGATQFVRTFGTLKGEVRRRTSIYIQCVAGNMYTEK